eukprot:CAMPEP_0206471646 /NCGR_PEP_ID=MMETSP0324_2-20121206/31698_1 /ASSEMBLY_ACC=CAM_ASM_000836 /TAXON_ID=2866 /ORGANISM="Crypthecodinium cohnii, Strain Seligo" /LENGTH=71 /DNA_ID=CAMNT_0053946033 /DNA_START=66 /DNA_END=281 /DNA_ORIENTATION=+
MGPESALWSGLWAFVGPGFWGHKPLPLCPLALLGMRASVYTAPLQSNPKSACEGRPGLFADTRPHGRMPSF